MSLLNVHNVRIVAQVPFGLENELEIRLEAFQFVCFVQLVIQQLSQLRFQILNFAGEQK